MTNEDIWQLQCLDKNIGSFKITATDQPWLIGEFTPLPEYEEHANFFSNFEWEYSNKTIENYDQFFSQLTENGYYWKRRNSQKMVRFILILSDTESRLRGQIIGSA